MNAGLKIVLFADYGSMGGTRTYFKQLLGLYAEMHACVTILTTYDDDDIEIDQLCNLYGFKCIKISSIVKKNTFQGRLPFRHLVEKNLFKNFLRSIDADIVVASVGNPEQFLGAISNASKAIYILHTCPEVNVGNTKRFLKGLFFKYLLSNNIKVLTVSKFSKIRILQAWGLSKKTCNVEYVYSTMGELVIDKVLKSKDQFHVLTLGHVVAYKNPDAWINMAILARQAEPLLDIRFTWVGEGDLLKKCQEKIENLGAQSYIRFVGRDDDVAKYYVQCDIYVQPSLIENLGLSALDAMRYGKPCVVANTGGLPELIRNAETGWVVDVNSPKDMAEKVCLLAGDPILCEKLGLAAMKLYQEKFTMIKWKKQMIHYHHDISNAL